MKTYYDYLDQVHDVLSSDKNFAHVTKKNIRAMLRSFFSKLQGYLFIKSTTVLKIHNVINIYPNFRRVILRAGRTPTLKDHC